MKREVDDDNVDNVIEAIKKKKYETENQYQILVKKLKSTVINPQHWYNAIQYLEETVIEKCSDPDNIVFSIHVFSQSMPIHFLLNDYLYLTKEQALKALDENGNCDKVPDYLAEYRKEALDLMHTLVTKWNEKHPTLVAEIVVPDDCKDVQYYFTNKKN